MKKYVNAVTGAEVVVNDTVSVSGDGWKEVKKASRRGGHGDENSADSEKGDAEKAAQ